MGAGKREPMPDAMYFRGAAEFRRWLVKHHASATELLVGFHKRETGEASLTWPESVDEALCVGWIDGIRRRVDDRRYSIRFTPRRPGSIWSAVNIRRAEALIAEGRMRRAGLVAFEARKEHRSGIYAYEQRVVDLPEPYATALRRGRKAHAFFKDQPASYRKAAVWYVVSAKREATRRRRLALLITCSATGRRLPQFLPTRRERPGP